MKKSLIAIVAFAFAAVSFAAQTPAKPAASNAGQSTTTNSTAKVKKSSHHKKPTKSPAKSTGASNAVSKQ
jgi:hypothetical protein